MPQWIQRKLPKWIRNRIKEAANGKVNIYQAKVEGVGEAAFLGGHQRAGLDNGTGSWSSPAGKKSFLLHICV
jgi:hypothetical protein